jgi:hypothetical protein
VTLNFVAFVIQGVCDDGARVFPCKLRKDPCGLSC